MHRHCVATGFSLAVLLFCLCSHGKDYANFTIKRGFVSHSTSGSTGGNIDAKRRFGDACLGLVSNTPDHHINVQEDLTLTLTVDSTTDSTLVVKGPAGTFCDDDSAGGNDARISARLSAGQYAVYVGDMYRPGYYRLTLSEGEPPLPKESKPTVEQYADFKFGRGFKAVPQISGGHTGAKEGQRLSDPIDEGECAGVIINEDPQHYLFAISEVTLSFFLESTTDAALIIIGESDDDLYWCKPNRSGDSNFVIKGSFLPGTYAIYVGHRSEPGNYRLTITELAGEQAKSI